MLVCWLPLVRDTNNYGLSDIAPVNSGATITSDGKLGNCYTFDGVDDYINLGTVTLTNEFSICFWTKITSFNGLHTPIDLYNPNTKAIIRLFSIYYPTNGTATFAVNDGTNKIIDTYSFTGLVTDKWYHISVTVKNNVVKLYMNGENIFTKTLSSFPWGEYNFALAKRQDGGGFYNGSINDLRLYDEAISYKQIKEISKGLVCHYKLSGISGENLVVNSGLYTKDNPFTNTSSSIDGIATSNMYMSVEVGETYTIQCCTDGIWGNHTNPGTGWTHIFLFLQTEGQTGYTYTKAVELANDPALGLTGKQSWTYTIPDDGNKYVQITFRFDIHSDGETSYTVKWWNLKAEKGTKATPWCPNKTDTLYSTLGFDDGIEYDCSGFSNDGEMSGDIVWDSESPRYSGSYDFNGTGYIKNDNFNLNTTEFTVSFWIKIPPTISSQHFLMGTFNSWCNNGIALWRDVDYLKYSILIKSDNESTHACTNLNLTADIWTHVTIVYTGTQYLVYTNGVLNYTVTYGSNGTVTNPVCYVGNSLYKGTASSETDESSVSDFRIYSTALDKDSIKELFQVGASVDSSGNLYCSEFEEV